MKNRRFREKPAVFSLLAGIQWADAQTSQGYRLKLLQEEVAPGGVFEGLHAWLDIHIERFGFFRPYRSYRGGMHPEPWHLSHETSAQRARLGLDIDVLARALGEADMLPELWARHVLGTDPA